MFASNDIPSFRTHQGPTLPSKTGVCFGFKLMPIVSGFLFIACSSYFNLDSAAKKANKPLILEEFGVSGIRE